MKISEIFKNLFPVLEREEPTGMKFDICFRTDAAGTFYKKLAIETAINLIANTIALAEFKTYEKGRPVRKENYYLLNIEPNINYNANKFWRKVISNLVYNNESLIIMQNDQLYIAEDFTKKAFAFKSNIYNNLIIDNYKLGDTFFEESVFYFELHSEKISGLIDGLYRDYKELIGHSTKSYKRNNSSKGILNIPTNISQSPRNKESISKLLNDDFKKFYESESGAVLPLANGMTYEDLTNNTYKNSTDSRDVRNLIDDVFDYVAIAFQIPPQMLKGTVSDNNNNWESYMTQCIKPLAELLEKEINRKMYGKKNYLEKSYLNIDTSLIKYNDITQLANTIDILTRNGINTLNDNLKLLGRGELDTEEGNMRFLTLNLQKYDDAISVNYGGEEKDEKQKKN